MTQDSERGSEDGFEEVMLKPNTKEEVVGVGERGQHEGQRSGCLVPEPRGTELQSAFLSRA